MNYVAGVDIGGTKIATVIMDSSGKIYGRSEVPSDSTNEEKMLEQVIACIEQVVKSSKITIQQIKSMGIGVPGKVDRIKGVAVFQNNLPWRNFPIVDRLKTHFPITNIVLDNDVYLAAFAEWKTDGAKEEETFVYLTVSTGISCAIIHKGDFIRGNGFAGELGLLPVRAGAAAKGFENLENAASGPAIKAFAEKRLTESNITTSEFFSRYEAQDIEAKLLMDEVVGSLAHGIYSIICLLDPHRIVLGGGVINNNPYVLDLIKEALKPHLIPEQLHSLECVRLSRLKEDSGIIGAGFRAFECS